MALRLNGNCPIDIRAQNMRAKALQGLQGRRRWVAICVALASTYQSKRWVYLFHEHVILEA
jgi:hypothetical protein